MPTQNKKNKKINPPTSHSFSTKSTNTNILQNTKKAVSFHSDTASYFLFYKSNRSYSFA